MIDSDWTGLALLALIILISLSAWLAHCYQRWRFDRAARRKPGSKQREQLLWVGDGMAPAGPHLLGQPVVIDGRKGVVVDHSLLTITVEWED